MDSQSLPSWLAPAIPPVELTRSEVRALSRENDEAVYPAVFERVLDHMADGNPLTAALEQYPLPVDVKRFRAWIHRDPERQRLYYEAKAVGGEALEDQMIEIADGRNSVEDVARSTLRIGVRKWLMGVWNRKRFGDVKQIDQTVTIDMTQAIADADARVNAQRTVDVVAREIR